MTLRSPSFSACRDSTGRYEIGVLGDAEAPRRVQNARGAGGPWLSNDQFRGVPGAGEPVGAKTPDNVLQWFRNGAARPVGIAP